MFKGVILGWIGRRIPDWGGIILAVAGGLLSVIEFYNKLPPNVKLLVETVVAGNWGSITLATIPGLVVWAWSQFMSFRSTVQPKVVTPEGEVKALKELPPVAKSVVVDTVESVPKKRDTITDLFKKVVLGSR